jgi:25S rRNA (uracil2634-N3)-methyltransferase
MGKRRRLGPTQPTTHRQAKPNHTSHAGSNKSPGHQSKSKATDSGAPSNSILPTIPFSPEDRILLVGEGDLSFSASLVEHHFCADVTATVLEKTLEELAGKYPHVSENIAKIEAEGSKVMHGVDATNMRPFVDKKGKDGVGVMDRIIFNFPHVGGKSTDVNRQVRYNQELLVSFFKQAQLSLAPGGSIIVTLFEGEPYTLWNVRDLARHSGLQVERSFRFQASAYPDYHHARTLGVVRNKQGEIGAGGRVKTDLLGVMYSNGRMKYIPPRLGRIRSDLEAGMTILRTRTET